MNIVFNELGIPVTVYESKEEMYYNLFLQMGLVVNNQGYLQDSDTGIVIRYKDKFIKVSLNPGVPAYAGRTDILFEPDKNFDLMSKLMSFYIDKRDHSDDPLGYIGQGIMDNKEYSVHSVFVKSHSGEFESAKYHNTYLGFIDCIFRMDGVTPELHQFDIWEEE